MIMWIQAAWIVEDSDQGADDDVDEEHVEGISLDAQAMDAEGDEDNEGSVISEEGDQHGFSSRATSVWDGDDEGRNEMMVSVKESPANCSPIV